MLARRLWLVIAFLGLLPSRPQGEQLFYYGDLYTSEDGAQAWTFAHSPYGWIYMELRLYRDSYPAAGRWTMGADFVYLWIQDYQRLPPFAWYVADGYAQGFFPMYEDVVEGWFWDGESTPGPMVQVDSASIPDDNIQVTLRPCGGYGPLTIQIEGGATPHTIFQDTRGGGTHNFSFDIEHLPNDREFTLVRATWQPNNYSEFGTLDYHFKVLGDYDNTQYNSPIEAQCSGSPVDMGYVSGTCTVVQDCSFTNFQGRSHWWDEVLENGSGLSETQGVVSREWFCSGVQNRVRRVPEPCAACTGRTLQPYATVAVLDKNSQDTPCGATLYVHGVGTRTVVDSGSLAPAQLDHYIGFTGCNQASSYGPRKVIRLY